MSGPLPDDLVAHVADVRAAMAEYDYKPPRD